MPRYNVTIANKGKDGEPFEYIRIKRVVATTETAAFLIGSALIDHAWLNRNDFEITATLIEEIRE